MRPRTKDRPGPGKICERSLSITLLLLSAGACAHPDQKHLTSPSAIEVLSEYQIALPEIDGVRGMAIPDTERLYILDSDGPYYLHVVDLRRRMEVQKFGREGEGPGELAGPESLQLVQQPTPHIWVMQANRRLMSSYDIADKPLFREAVRFESRTPIMKALMLRSGMVVSGAIRNGGALTAGDSTFHRQRPWGAAPYRPEELSPVQVFDANWAYLATDPAETRIVAAFRFAAEIQVMDTAGTVLHRIIPANGVGHPNTVSPPFNFNFLNDTSDIAYVAVAASERLIVAVYCGCHGRVRRAETGPAYLQVYRYDGTLVGIQEIRKHVTGVAISQDGQTIYYSADSPEPAITVLKVRYTSDSESSNE